MNDKKKWYQSKTLWTNLLAVGAGIFAPDAAFGHVFSPAEVATALGIGNLLLRLTTNKGLTN